MPGFYFLKESMLGPRQSQVSGVAILDLPVKIKQNAWTQFDSPRRIARLYSFDDPGQQGYFVSEIMRMIGTVDHPVKIIIEGDSVQVETRTETIDDITELDLEISRNIDEIYDDALFILVQS